MGYSTDFAGRLEIRPPLNAHETAYLTAYAETRHQPRRSGPYTVAADPHNPNAIGDPDVTDHDRDLPNIWCDWQPTPDGTALAWNGTEKSYSAPEWIAYPIDTFLRPGAALHRELAHPVPGHTYPPQLAAFTFDHTLNGLIQAQGQQPDHRYRITVTDNEVHVTSG